LEKMMCKEERQLEKVYKRHGDLPFEKEMLS